MKPDKPTMSNPFDVPANELPAVTAMLESQGRYACRLERITGKNGWWRITTALLPSNPATATLDAKAHAPSNEPPLAEQPELLPSLRDGS